MPLVDRSWPIRCSGKYYALEPCRVVVGCSDPKVLFVELLGIDCQSLLMLADEVTLVGWTRNVLFLQTTTKNLNTDIDQSVFLCLVSSSLISPLAT